MGILDCARLIKSILDALPQNNEKSENLCRCAKVIQTGLRHIRAREMIIEEGYLLYLDAKKHLRPDSLRDIRYIGRKLLRVNAEFAKRNFSEVSSADCEEWLTSAFTTSPQFNKARAMLHGLFEFALRRGWCGENPVKRIERRKVIEREIAPLTLAETRKLLDAAETIPNCAVPAGLLILAGIRPREVRRLEWRDIDLRENSITVRSQCSKTGGIRQVEICPALKRILRRGRHEGSRVCPRNWDRHWRKIREKSGLGKRWVQDVLRHTYASHHAKRFRDLPRLQLNMGHGNQALLRSRYVNMRGLSKCEAARFFKI